MKRFKGFTIGEHVRAAELIRSVESQLRELLSMCGQAYGWSSPITKKAHNTSRLRALLDDAYIQETAHQRFEGYLPSPYYKINALPEEVERIRQTYRRHIHTFPDGSQSELPPNFTDSQSEVAR
jgi:hypothetical protein